MKKELITLIIVFLGMLVSAQVQVEHSSPIEYVKFNNSVNYNTSEVNIHKQPSMCNYLLTSFLITQAVPNTGLSYSDKVNYVTNPYRVRQPADAIAIGGANYLLGKYVFNRKPIIKKLSSLRR